MVTAANLQGRADITGIWYDILSRVADQVSFGTYGGSNFDRDGMTVPARSDTALRTRRIARPDGYALLGFFEALPFLTFFTFFLFTCFLLTCLCTSL